jgi:hypothetical protein
MTAYLVFEAIRDGQLALDRQVPASAAAAAAPRARACSSPRASRDGSPDLLRGSSCSRPTTPPIALAEAVATPRAPSSSA